MHMMHMWHDENVCDCVQFGVYIRIPKDSFMKLEI